MRQKIILIGLMMFVASFAIGQNEVLKNHEKFDFLQSAKDLKRSEFMARGGNHGRTFRKNRSFSQNSKLKSVKQRLDSLITQDWDESTKQWIASSKDEYTYNGNMLQDLYYYWDETTSQWMTLDKTEYTFDAYRNLTQRLDYSWDETTSQWMTSSKEEYTYDANGYRIQLLFYFWDEQNNQWGTPQYKKEYTYDSNENLTQRLDYRWDEATSQWRTSQYKTEYTYDANGNMTQDLYYYWDETTSQWMTLNKTEYTFDAYGNMTQYLHYNWSKVNNQWVTYYKEEYTWDNMYSYNDLILPIFYDAIKHKLISGLAYIKWDTWTPVGKTLLYYSNQELTSVNSLEPKKDILYPNPFSEHLSFSFSSNHYNVILELFDMQGHKVMAIEVTNTEILSLEGLNKGMYFYNLLTDGEIQSGKLIKE